MKLSTFAVAVLLALGASAGAAERGVGAGGEPYIMGGIGLDEVDLLASERAHYSLWVRTAARHSGSYLADVRLTISDAQGRIVFDQRLAGPWLLIRLRPGPYRLEASYAGESERQAVTVPASGGREAIFYFDVPEGSPS